MASLRLNRFLVSRRSALALLILLLLGIVSSILFLKFFPPSKGWVTVTSIEIKGLGQVALSYESVFPSGAKEITRQTIDGGDEVRGGGGGWDFPPLTPTRGSSTIHFHLDPEREINGGINLEVRAKQAIKVEVGQTYEVRLDSPLLLYRFKTANGHVYQGVVEIIP